jgi:hypothetical protein
MVDAEKTIIDEPDRTLDGMKINIVGEANDTYGHPSQESDVTVNAENSNVDEPDRPKGRYSCQSLTGALWSLLPMGFELA